MKSQSSARFTKETRLGSFKIAFTSVTIPCKWPGSTNHMIPQRPVVAYIRPTLKYCFWSIWSQLQTSEVSMRNLKRLVNRCSWSEDGKSEFTYSFYKLQLRLGWNFFAGPCTVSLLHQSRRKPEVTEIDKSEDDYKPTFIAASKLLFDLTSVLFAEVRLIPTATRVLKWREGRL